MSFGFIKKFETWTEPDPDGGRGWIHGRMELDKEAIQRWAKGHLRSHYKSMTPEEFFTQMKTECTDASASARLSNMTLEEFTSWADSKFSDSYPTTHSPDMSSDSSASATSVAAAASTVPSSDAAANLSPPQIKKSHSDVITPYRVFARYLNSQHLDNDPAIRKLIQANRHCFEDFVRKLNDVAVENKLGATDGLKLVVQLIEQAKDAFGRELIHNVGKNKGVPFYSAVSKSIDKYHRQKESIEAEASPKQD
jgi:hypothetical protein